MKHYLNQKPENKSLISQTGESNTGYLGDIIREIGLSLSKSQELLDENWITAQRERLKALLENQDLVLPSSSSFVIPEANLELGMEINGKYDSSGKFKIQTKPHNAETSSKSSLVQSVSSKVALKFVMIPEDTPQNKKTHLENQSELTNSAVIDLAKQSILANNAKESKPKINHTRLVSKYIQDSRKWHINAFEGTENIALLIIDDTTAEQIGPILLLSENFRTKENTDELSNPIILSVNKLNAVSGDTIIVTGENLGALNINDTEVTINGQKVNLLEVSFEKISFKISPDLTSGHIQVQTPEGYFKFNSKLIINATPLSFVSDSGYGYFNLENNLGSLIKISGENIESNTKLKFTNGAIADVTNTDVRIAEFRVPLNAKSGQVSFLTNDHEIKMEGLFYLRPFIKDVYPKEARKDEMIKLTGNHFSNTNRVKIGDNIFELSNISADHKVQSIKSDQTLLIKIPGRAGDGRLMIESHQRWWDTSVFFYQVPKIEKMPDYLIVGQNAKIYGSGFGKTHQGLYLEFEKNEFVSIIESTFVSDDNNLAEQYLGFKVRDHLISDKVRLIRSDIADENNYDATTTLWKRKIFVFKKGTQLSDIKWCKSNWDQLDQFWQLTNLTLTSQKVLKAREESNELKFSQHLSTLFSFYGEFYAIKNLNFKLKLLDQNKTFAGTLNININPSEVKIKLTDLSNQFLDYNIPLIDSIDEQIDQMIVQFHCTNEKFVFQVNETISQIDLENDTSPLQTIISQYLTLSTAIDFSLDTNVGAFIGSIVLSSNPTLSIPKYSKTNWDFEVTELQNTVASYTLEDLKSFPTTETKTFTVFGTGFTAYSTVMINETSCLTTFNQKAPNQLTVSMPGSAQNGELVVIDYFDTSIQSNPIAFKIIQGASIDSVSPRQVSSGNTIIIRGNHLTDNGIPQVYIEKFGPLKIKEITDDVIEIIAPKITLINGVISLKYGDLDRSISPNLIDISALNNYDLLQEAPQANWIVPVDFQYPTVLNFGSVTDRQQRLGSVDFKYNVTLDSGEEFKKSLTLTCPASEYHYLEGRFEDFYIPKGSEFIFQFGFPVEARQTDGIKFSVFLELKTKHINIIDRVFRGYGESLSDLKFKSQETHPKGTLVIRVEPGSSGYDDHLALVKAEMQFTHIEDGWTWLFGSEHTNRLTIPGIQGESSIDNRPGSRSFPAVWQDLQGQIWLFGGKGNDVNPRTGRLNDLWKFDGDQWTWEDGLISKNGFAKFSEAQGEVTTPGARYASAYWQDEKGVFWLFGGHGYHESGRQRCLNDLWKYEDGNWTMMSISKNWKTNGAHGLYGSEGLLLDHQKNEISTKYWPLTRSHSSFFYDENTNLFWLFGGQYTEPNDEFFISDLWTFDGQDWTLMHGDDTQNYEPAIKMIRPSARTGASIWVDKKGILWLFGGTGFLNKNSRTLNDLWQFKKGSNNKWSWTRISAPQLNLHDNFYKEIGIPGPRSHASIWKDKNDTIWLFGGEGSNTDLKTTAPLNDLWKFENNSWEFVKGPIEERDMGDLSAPKIPYPDSWPSARFGCATWQSPAGWLMLFGGKGYGESETGRKSLGRLQQMWQFSPEIDNT